MKKIILSTLYCLAIISGSTQALEALCDDCSISKVQPDSAIPGVLIYANVGTNWASSGDCSSTSTEQRMYILENTAMAKEIYSAALTALSAGIAVTIKGTGTCVGGIETVRFIALEK